MLAIASGLELYTTYIEIIEANIVRIDASICRVHFFFCLCVLLDL